MDVARHSVPIHNHLSRQATQLEQIDLLPIELENTRSGIRKTYEGKIILQPIGFERHGIFGSYNYDLRLSPKKFLMFLAQLRHVPLAERSGEASIKNKHNIRSVSKIRQLYCFSTKVLQ
jgi:hypothetical protein